MEGKKGVRGEGAEWERRRVRRRERGAMEEEDERNRVRRKKQWRKRVWYDRILYYIYKQNSVGEEN